MLAWDLLLFSCRAVGATVRVREHGSANMESERNKSAFTWTWYGVGMDLVRFGSRGKRLQAAMMVGALRDNAELAAGGGTETRATSDKGFFTVVLSNERAPPLAAN